MSESQLFLKLKKLENVVAQSHGINGYLLGYLSFNNIAKHIIYIINQKKLKKKPQTKVTQKSWIISIITPKVITIGKVKRKAFFFKNSMVADSSSCSVVVAIFSIKLYLKDWFVNLSVADFRRKKYVHI